MRLLTINSNRILFFLILAMLLVMYGSAIYSERIWQTNAKPTTELIKAIGYSGLSLSSDCTSTRNPILESTCITDIPGGYCYHDSCGMIDPTTVGTQYSLKITHFNSTASR